MAEGESLPTNGNHNFESLELSTDLESRYQSERDSIRDFYSKVWVWHGTGRFEQDKEGFTDILAGILEAGEIRPYQDIWDGTLRTTETISATWVRPYAAFYADMHLRPDEKLQFKDPRKFNILKMSAPDIKTILKKGSALASLLKNLSYIRKQKQAAKDWMERKTGQQVESNIWGQAARFGTLKSQTPGDYPILIGFTDKAFEPIITAQYIAATEVRAAVPIPLNNITHIEVPLDHLTETEELLKSKNITIPVIPREFGERYSTEFSDQELLTGKGFRK